MAQLKVSMPASRIDVRQELEEARLGRFHIRLGILISLILLFDGYDLYNSAYIVHYVTGPWGLSPVRIGVMLSSGLAGFALKRASESDRSCASPSGAPVAQLDRVPGYEPGGREFESLRARQ